MSLINKLKRYTKKNLRYRSHEVDRHNLQDLLSLVDHKKHPNINDLWWVIKDTEVSRKLITRPFPVVPQRLILGWF